MAHVTFIARSMDGLILVETWDDVNNITATMKSQAKQLLKKLKDGPARCSIDGAGEFVFHYMIEDGVCYMGLWDKNYPKKLSFAFLEDVHKSFQEELKREFGTRSVDYRSHIDTIEKPYYFIKFDRQIQKKRVDYRDPSSTKALNRLNENLTEVSSIMRQNIDEILHRGENLEDVGRKASNLKFASKEFVGMTRMLTLHTLMKKYGVLVVIVLVVLLVMYFKMSSR